MMDTEQEEKEIARVVVMKKLESMTPDELSAIANLCVAFLDEADPVRLTRQKRAIYSLMGDMTLLEWIVLGPVVGVRYGQVFPMLEGA